ncbi:SKI family transcriptional corepressor 1 homolog-B-like [Asterias rubens]|uniref:SKI family transcriptional corepressor 1 homolog-B-like n=1 Tax=Asterias rubens TaxID=7604 RepID=UPI00145506F7|nr:SKI family transcriptional corepressor 1 homolog-B-like [Asterias rubens]
MEETPRQTPETAPSPNQQQHGMREHSRTPSMSSEPECTHSNNQCYMVNLFGVQIAALIIDSQERLCLAQISNTLLKKFSYNEIHNRRVALGITCVQCTPVQLEILRRANAMPVSSRRCGMINKREAERLCKSFLTENRPPKLPENFSFEVYHECTWGCQGAFVPSRYNSSRAKCIRCSYCSLFSSPNKFIFHAHRMPNSKFHPPDGPNFNSWRRHIKLVDRNPSEELLHAWEDVKAMFNGGSRKRSVCESSSKMPPTSFGCPIDSRSSSAQRLLPSPPKRGRYGHEPVQEQDPTLMTAANVPYPLMPIPNRSTPTTFTETLPEDPPTNSMPTYPVNVFHGHLSPSSFRQHPFMEFLWSGARAGCPLPSATMWPKSIGMPFVSNASYYQPLMGPDSDIHTVIDQGSPTNTPTKKPNQWDDFESKYGMSKPKGVSNRHQYLPDFRKAAYYTSAFRPVITSKGCLDPEGAFSNAERFMFPPKSVTEECFVSSAQQDQRCEPSSYNKPKHHQVLTPDDQKKPLNLNHLTRKLVPEVDQNDKHEESNATVKRTPSSRGSGSLDAGADLADERGECLRERLDLGAERPQRTTPVAKIESPRASPDTLLSVGHLPPSTTHIIKACPTPSLSSEDEEHAVHSQTEDTAVESVAKLEQQYRRNVVAHQLIAREHQLSTEIEMRRNAYLTAQQKYRENQGALNHFSRHILSSHGTCMD